MHLQVHAHEKGTTKTQRRAMQVHHHPRTHPRYSGPRATSRKDQTHPHTRISHTHTFQPKDSELMTHKHALDIRQVKKKPQKKRRPGRDTELSTSTQTKAIAAPSSDRRRKTSWRTPSLGQAAPVARPSQESNGPANQKGQTIQLNTSIYPAGRREKDC